MTRSPLANLPPEEKSLPSTQPPGMGWPTFSPKTRLDNPPEGAAAAGGGVATRCVEKGRAARGGGGLAWGGARVGGGGLAAGGARAGGGGFAAGGARAGGGGLATGTGAVPLTALGGGAETLAPIPASAAGMGFPRLIPSSARDAPASPTLSSSTHTSHAFCHGRPVLPMTSPSLSLPPRSSDSVKI
jgi:hypothetical protein